MRHTLFICSTCCADDESVPRGDALGSVLQEMFADSVDPAIRAFDIRGFDCMSACANPNAISFRAEGKAAYLFAGVDPVADRKDILEFAKLYVAAADGWIEDARPCGRLRHCLTGRIPAQEAGVAVIGSEKPFR